MKISTSASKRCSDAVRISDIDGGIGICSGQNTGIFSDSPGMTAVQAFSADAALLESNPQNARFGLGPMAMLIATVPAGQQQTLRFAACFFRDGIVTTGLPTSYFYRRYYARLEDVASYSLANFAAISAQAEASEQLLDGAALRPSQRWQLIHAIRSYYASTQFLEYQQVFAQQRTYLLPGAIMARRCSPGNRCKNGNFHKLYC